MLLTNDLPYRGNGSFTIYTFAHDAGGHREEIGRKTILCDNINRVKPFGTIDTPEQGEIIRGSDSDGHSLLFQKQFLKMGVLSAYGLMEFR